MAFKPIRLCPSCGYDLRGQADGPRLVCPECGAECSRTQAESVYYRRRSRMTKRVPVVVGVGSAIQLLGFFMSNPLIGLAAWGLGAAMILAGSLVYARQTEYGFGRWWPIVGIGIAAAWMVLFHGVMVMIYLMVMFMVRIF